MDSNIKRIEIFIPAESAVKEGKEKVQKVYKIALAM